MPPYFVDTAYAIALSDPEDPFHGRARELGSEISANKIPLVTTRAILLEIGSTFAKQRYREAGIRLINSIHADRTVQLVAISDELFQRGLKLFSARLDKDWSLTDCISFEVMWDSNLTEALTTDRHFEQAGFKCMLR